MEKTFITISHLDDFMSAGFLEPGTKLELVKEPNSYDAESISVYSERGAKCGYVANNWKRVIKGTHSAGYIHRDFEDRASCIVRFRSDDLAVAELLTEPDLKEQ